MLDANRLHSNLDAVPYCRRTLSSLFMAPSFLILVVTARSLCVPHLSSLLVEVRRGHESCGRCHHRLVPAKRERLRVDFEDPCTYSQNV